MKLSAATKTYLKFLAFAALAGALTYAQDNQTAKITWEFAKAAIVAGLVKAALTFVKTPQD